MTANTCFPPPLSLFSQKIYENYCYHNLQLEKMVPRFFILFLIFVAIGLLFTSFSSAQTSGIIAEYNFDENAGIITNDLSGNGITGVLVNGTSWTSNGKYSVGLSFDGINDYVSLGNRSVLTPANAITISAWVKTNTNSGAQMIVSKYSAGANPYQLRIQGSNIRFSVKTTTEGTITTTSSPIPVGQWKYITGTWDGTTMKVYVDGVLASPTLAKTGTMVDNPIDVRIGGSANGVLPFNGLIDDVRIYDRALSLSEIVNDMNTPLFGNVTIDTIPPVVSITSPLNNSNLSGVISVNANATDNVGVVGVQFKLDGNDLGSEDFTFPYSVSWNTSTAADGIHTLTAVARDSAGNGATSSDVVVNISNNVPDTTPPNVTIISPIDGRNVSNELVIWATATDNFGVAGVQFQVDGVNIGVEDITDPYSVTFDTTGLQDGFYNITAIARDISNNSASTKVTGVVCNANPVVKKNFFIVVTDDQRFDSMQFMPLINSLIGNDSVQFTNAVVNTPICCPSRASIFTGLYTHNHGVLHVAPPLGGAQAFNDSSTIAIWLNQTGYRTGLFGKYLNSYELVNGGQYVPPGWDDWHAFVELFRGKEAGPYYNYTMNNNGVLNEEGDLPENYSTDVILNKTLEFIQSTPSNESLFIYFAPYAPHLNSVPAPQDVGLFSNIPDWRPPSFNEANVSDKPLWIRSLPLLSNQTITKNDANRRAGLETLQAVDRATAAIINELNATNRLNDTIIIYTSDNGFSWGEHRWDNKFCIYEECVRVPFWFWTGYTTGRVDNSIISNIDIAPTLADLAGFIPPSKVNGASFANLVINANAPWRNETLIEFDEINPALHDMRTFEAVRTHQYVYAEYVNGDRELYDLVLDPDQLDNKINDPSYASVITTLQGLLNQLRSE